MGRRHQAYLIARVTPKSGESTTAYRCVAAVHHQYCYREFTLQAILNEGVISRFNNDGITVVDVTDPYKISLHISCPYDIDEDEDEDDEDYDYEPVFDDRDREIISQVEHIPLLTPQALSEAWPSEFKVEDYPEPDDSDSTIPSCDSPSSRPSKLPSLVDIALDAALGQCIKDGEGFEHLLHVGNVPGVNETILARLKDSSCFPASFLSLLRKVLEKAPGHPKKVDLSGYMLTGPQVYETVSSASDPEELDISFDSVITKADLLTILPFFPHLKLLNLIGTTLSNEDISSLLSHKPPTLPHIKTILHPFFTDPEQPLNASQTVQLGSFASTMPILSSDAAIQMISEFLELSSKLDYYPRARYGFEHLEAVFGMVIACFQRQNEAWDDRLIPLLPKMGYVAGNKKKSFIFYLRPHRGVELKSDEMPPFSYGFLAPIQKSSDTDGSKPSGDAKEGLYLQRFFTRSGFHSQDPSHSDITGDTVEILPFSAFLERLQEEDFPPTADIAKLEAVAEVFEKMGLVTIEEFYKEERW
ncbi:hypothetical protein BKA70DRAFT_1566863 [Coprinopsis sp. MPI-PUGE-AT-0042]|nr:hypothetical protein BKA70DRAFT_1566863 [Coprinopsis sp. MPI-PUGE-AT-0042]